MCGENLKIIWILSSILGILFSLLFTIYFLDNPTDTTSYGARYPYILSLSPGQIQQNGSIDIGFSSFLSTNNQSIITTTVVNPDGELFKSNRLSLNGSIIYPKDFVGSNSNILGNYTVAIIRSDDDILLISSSFSVLASPFLSSFSNFIFGNGIGLTIGVVGTVATMAYQIVSQHNQDRARRLDEKAKWMLENTKYYMALFGNSSSICNAFLPKGKTQPDTKDVLFYTTKFYSDYLVFKKNCGFYYFDDYLTEAFIANLDDKIFRLFDDMTGDYSQLKQFFELKDQTEFTNHKHFAKLRDKVSLWLSDGNNANTYYLAHLVYKSVLLVSINKGLMITYSSTSKIMKTLELSMVSDKDAIVSHINLLNHEFYDDNKDLYYRFFSERRKS
jgi:hypothetical protein